MISGAFLVVFGTFMASLSTEYWQVLLAQAVCTGLGNGCLLTPMMVVVSTHFKRKLPLVLGIAACGSVTGGLVFPSMVRTLLPTVGYGWTMRAIGFIQLATLVIAVASARTRLAPKRSGPLLDWAAFGDIEFDIYALGCFLVSFPSQIGAVFNSANHPTTIQSFLGVFFGFFFLSSYARDIQGMTYTQSLNLLLVLNGIGFISRMLPSLLARYFGTLNTFIALLFGSSLSMFTWIAVSTTPGLYVWTIYFSLVIGGVQSLFPATVATFSPDLQRLGSRMGIIFGVIGFAALIGSPISGVLISEMNGSYLGAQAFGGSCLAAGCMFVLAAREIRRRRMHYALASKM